MRIRWTVPAADDLQNIKNYLQRHYPHFGGWPTSPVRGVTRVVFNRWQRKTGGAPEPALSLSKGLAPFRDLGFHGRVSVGTLNGRQITF
jgi:hypothetical protein